MPEYLTIKEVADELRVSKMTVYRMIESGQLPALRIAGRSFRVRRRDYESYVIARSSGPQAHESSKFAQPPWPCSQPAPLTCMTTNVVHRCDWCEHQASVDRELRP